MKLVRWMVVVLRNSVLNSVGVVVASGCWAALACWLGLEPRSWVHVPVVLSIVISVSWLVSRLRR